jgi:hypothetical protein
MTYFYGHPARRVGISGAAGGFAEVAAGPLDVSKPPPLPQPVTPATTNLVRIVGRSSILPVGPRIGTISCPLSVRRVVQDALIPGGQCRP